MNYIFGSSGFGKEVLWILQQNKMQNIFFVELSEEQERINNIEVISQDYFKTIKGIKNCFLAVGSPAIREKIYEDIKEVPNVTFPNLVDPSVRQNSIYNIYGKGNIICAGSIITTNVFMGDFNHVNLNTTIGHDTSIKNFCTFSPGCNISGCVQIGNQCFFGTNSTVLENLKIIDNSIVGANALITKDLEKSGIYVGIPAKLRS